MTALVAFLLQQRTAVDYEFARKLYERWLTHCAYGCSEQYTELLYGFVIKAQCDAAQTHQIMRFARDGFEWLDAEGGAP